MYLSISLSLSLSLSLSVCLSIYLSICKLENEASLRDVLRFWTWQHQKRSNSERPPQFLNLTMSKMKQVCETSSFFKVDNIKNEAILRTSSIFQLDNVKNKEILRDFLIFRSWQHQKRKDSARLPSKMESCVQSWRPRTNAFRDFPVHLSKLPRLPRKSDARSYDVPHLSRKIISANLKIWCSKMQPLSGNHRSDLLTALMKMSLALRLTRKMHLCRSSSQMHPLRMPRGTTSERPRVVRNPGAFNMLTVKFASRHNGVHFFDISTSKSGPNVKCF